MVRCALIRNAAGCADASYNTGELGAQSIAEVKGMISLLLLLLPSAQVTQPPETSAWNDLVSPEVLTGEVDVLDLSPSVSWLSNTKREHMNLVTVSGQSTEMSPAGVKLSSVLDES